MKNIKLFEEYVLKDLEADHNIKLDLWEAPEHLELGRIELAREDRGFGIGTIVMQKICEYADEVGKKIYLTPSKDFGASSISRLEHFYKSFGFIKKPKDDFSVRHTMVRFPETNEAKKAKTIIAKIQDIAKKMKKFSEKGKDSVDKIKDLQDKQKEGDAKPSDKLNITLQKVNADIAKVDMEKSRLKQQQLGIKQKIKTAKDSEKAKAEVARKKEAVQKESLLIEGKPKGAPEWKDSDAPDANGRFKELSAEDLAAWLIKTRDGDIQKITGSLNQQIVFNRNEDPDYADKMERTRKEVYKQLDREDLLKESNETEAQYNDYPAAASKNAQKAIDWKEEHGRDEVSGGTEVGWARAHQLAKGEKLSRDVVSRMAQFNRHRKNSKVSAEFKDEPWKDKGYIAWLIWGGDEGVDWAIEKMKEIEKTEMKESKSFKHVKTFESFVDAKAVDQEDSELEERVEHIFNVLEGKVSREEILEAMRPMLDEGFLDFIKGLFTNPFVKRKIGKLADELFAVRVEIGKLGLEGDPVERYKEELEFAKTNDRKGTYGYTDPSEYETERGSDIHDTKIKMLEVKEEAISTAMDNLAGDNEALLKYVEKVKLEVRMKETEMLMKIADSEVRRIMGQIKRKDMEAVRALDNDIRDMVDA